MFGRLWRALSDSFWVATVISSPCVKSRKFPKIAIFAIFGIFGCWSFRLQKSIKIVKNVKIFQNKLFTSQRCFQIPIMKFYDHYIQFYVNLKISKKLYFLSFEAFWLFWAEICIFCWFSNLRKIEYIHHRMSFWVSERFFGI